MKYLRNVPSRLSAGVLAGFVFVRCAYGLGHWPFALFAVGVALLLLLVRRFVPRLGYVFATSCVLILLLLTSPVLQTLTFLWTFNTEVVLRAQSPLSDLFTTGAGQQVLPEQVQQMLGLMDSHQISTYRLSQDLTGDPLTYQRIVESAWPRRLTPSSPYLFLLRSELEVDPTCVRIDQEKEIALVYCP